MALTMARAQAALNTALASVTHVEWSTDGSSVTSRVAATAVTLESAVDMTTYARKGIDVASPPQLSAACTAGADITVTHWRFTTASSGGTAQTSWNALTAGVTLAAGEQIRINDAGIGEKITLA